MITPTSIKHGYAFLRKLPPFKGWKLPAQIEAKVSNDISEYGSFDEPDTITISKARIWDVDAMLKTIAHEMVHLYQFRCKEEGEPPYHNTFFYECAKEVCRELGWKEETF